MNESKLRSAQHSNIRAVLCAGGPAIAGIGLFLQKGEHIYMASPCHVRAPWAPKEGFSLLDHTGRSAAIKMAR